MIPADPSKVTFFITNRVALGLSVPTVLISSHSSHMETPMSSIAPVSNAQKSSYSPDDDLTGVTSAALRRRIQNRLNQRAYREKFAHL